jgi:phenylpyruvate tautomerase PptA (4-oxalocrotonate tautomerase family)
LSKSQCGTTVPPIKSCKIAKRISDTLVEEAGARREAMVVAFHEISKEGYASGGESMIDKVN